MSIGILHDEQAVSIARAVALVMKYEPERYEKIMKADTLVGLADALGVYASDNISDTWLHLREKYRA